MAANAFRPGSVAEGKRNRGHGRSHIGEAAWGWRHDATETTAAQPAASPAPANSAIASSWVGNAANEP